MATAAKDKSAKSKGKGGGVYMAGSGADKELNPFSSPAIGIVLKTPVRPKKTNGKPIKIRAVIAKAVNKKIPEVVVKIKRGGKSAQHLMAHLEYITRNGKLDAETDRGEVIQGKAHLKEVFKEWTSDVESVRPGSRNAINAIFSMPPGTPPEGVKEAVRRFAKQELSNYQYMFVLHTDEPHPHCHISIRTLGLDGKKLDPRKDDIQLWREVFAEKLNELGIDAKATYRPTRGIIEKPLSMAQYKAKYWATENPDKVKDGEKPRRTERDFHTFEKRVKAAAQSIQSGGKEPAQWESGKHKKADPWQEQQEIRQAWQTIATDLQATGIPEDIQLADEIRQFVAEMPPIQTQHERIRAELLAMREAGKTKQAEANKGKAPIAQTPAAPTPAPAANRDTGQAPQIDGQQPEQDDTGRER